jgi:hypothetical protein
MLKGKEAKQARKKKKVEGASSGRVLISREKREGISDKITLQLYGHGAKKVKAQKQLKARASR